MKKKVHISSDNNHISTHNEMQHYVFVQQRVLNAV